ncbi:MAG: protein phosphatase 2C domain-containing protein, partial [Peptococcaceae bacterium]|nr:protein phosphatase 2C domain-containing protein [Peptococcaceae bacterium]
LAEYAGTVKAAPPDETDAAVQGFVANANQLLCAQMNQKSVRMGTTLAMILVTPDVIKPYNLGDSRIYALSDEGFRQISEDHTLIMQKVRMGIITEDQARFDRDRHKLTQYLGIFEDELTVVAEVLDPLPLERDYRVLLCSDGLTDMVDGGRIEEILRDALTPAGAADRLVNEALSNGGKDNVTCIVVDVAGSGGMRARAGIRAAEGEEGNREAVDAAAGFPAPADHTEENQPTRVKPKRVKPTRMPTKPAQPETSETHMTPETAQSARVTPPSAAPESPVPSRVKKKAGLRKRMGFKRKLIVLAAVVGLSLILAAGAFWIRSGKWPWQIPTPTQTTTTEPTQTTTMEAPTLTPTPTPTPTPTSAPSPTSVPGATEAPPQGLAPDASPSPTEAPISPSDPTPTSAPPPTPMPSGAPIQPQNPANGSGSDATNTPPSDTPDDQTSGAAEQGVTNTLEQGEMVVESESGSITSEDTQE